MFTKNNVSQSLVDAVKNIIDEAGPIKEPTATGVKVYGRSYGNSAKAKQDQTKSSVDDLKGPKAKELLQKDKEDHMKTKGRYDEELKGDQHKIDANKNKKIDAHDFAILRGKKKVAEELKGDQHKIDANKNNKVDAHDFAILRGKKKVKEGREFTEKLLEMVRKSDVPAYLRKAKGDTPLTMADVKDPKKDTISDPKNLAKARNEEVDQIDEVSLKTATSAYVKRMGDDGPNEKSSIAKATKTMDLIAKKYGVRGVARATKTADDKYGLNDPVHNPRKAFVKQTMANVKKEEVEHLNEDDFAHAKKQGWSVSQHYHHTKITHPKHGIVSVDRYGEWHHHPEQDWVGRPKGDLVAHGQFDKLNKHLSSLKEEVESLDEKNVPTSPEKWAQAKAQAKAKFDVYPSAYANGWASKKYKAMGGGWKTANEEVDQIEEKKMTDADMKERERIVKGMKKGLSGFKARYGARAKDVMYATATKQAMKEAAEDSSAITTDTLIGRMPGGKSNDFKSYKLRIRPLDKEGEKEPKDATPIAIQPDDTPARKSHETKQPLKLKEGKRPETDDAPPFEGPYTKIPSNVKDKSGAIHTPMSRARNLAQAAMKKLKTEMMGKLGTSESKK